MEYRSHINELIWILFCDFSNVYVYNFRVWEDRDGGHFQCFQLWVFNTFWTTKIPNFGNNGRQIVHISDHWENTYSWQHCQQWHAVWSQKLLQIVMSTSKRKHVGGQFLALTLMGLYFVLVNQAKTTTAMPVKFMCDMCESNFLHCLMKCHM